MNSNRLLLPLGAFLIALLLSIFLIGHQNKKGPQIVEDEKHPLPEIFSLEFKDTTGKKIFLKDLPHGFRLLYFGTFYASELTPRVLKIQKEILEYKFREPLTPIFFSLDPNRDKPDLVIGTLKMMNSQTTVLYGEEEMITNLSKDFGVRSRKTILDQSKLEYTIDQSPWMYLTTPDFRIVGAYPIQITRERLKMEIDAHMKRKR
ncbi:MAG: SCO family protein [Leptospira sp.]|nr:SCO family protein [Leptospira sp.]